MPSRRPTASIRAHTAVDARTRPRPSNPDPTRPSTPHRMSRAKIERALAWRTGSPCDDDIEPTIFAISRSILRIEGRHGSGLACVIVQNRCCAAYPVSTISDRSQSYGERHRCDVRGGRTCMRRHIRGDRLTCDGTRLVSRAVRPATDAVRLPGSPAGASSHHLGRTSQRRLRRRQPILAEPLVTDRATHAK